MRKPRCSKNLGITFKLASQVSGGNPHPTFSTSVPIPGLLRLCVCVCVFALLKLSLITEKSTKPCSVKKYHFHQKARFGNFWKRKAVFLLCWLCFFSQDAESSGTGPPATEGPPTPGPLTRGRWELLDGSDFVVLTKSSFLVKQMTLQCDVLSIWIRGCVQESVSCHLLSLSLQKNLGQILLSVTRDCGGTCVCWWAI